MTAHCDDCREYESHIERMQESEDELACLLREAAEAEGWDTEKWCHWQSDARAALERAPNPEEARAIAFDRFMQATDTMGMPADTVAVLRPGEDERIAEEIGLAGYG